jgi:hypothetical protein
MGDLVNLNKTRKKKRAADKDKSAEQNRAKFGRTKAEKAHDADLRKKFERGVDAHQRDDDT